MIRVRHAGADDAGAIARIQVAAWRAGYRHILPAAFLAELDEADRAERWHGRIGPAARPDAPTFVAVDDTDAVVGFVHTGPVRDADLEPDGRAEVYTLYVDPGAWRLGIGAALLRAVDEFWAPAAVRELVLWTFEENTASRRFYEAMGWRLDGARQADDFGGAHPVEVRYRRPR